MSSRDKALAPDVRREKRLRGDYVAAALAMLRAWCRDDSDERALCPDRFDDAAWAFHRVEQAARCAERLLEQLGPEGGMAWEDSARALLERVRGCRWFIEHEKWQQPIEKLVPELLEEVRKLQRALMVQAIVTLDVLMARRPWKGGEE